MYYVLYFILWAPTVIIFLSVAFTLSGLFIILFFTAISNAALKL